MSEQLLTIQDLCKRLLVSRQSIHKWIKKGKLKPIRIGRVIRFESSDIDKLIEQSRQKDKVGVQS